MINKTLQRRIKLSASPWKVAEESSTSSSIEMLTDLMLFNYFLPSNLKKKENASFLNQQRVICR